MAAERDKLQDIEETKGDDSSDDSTAIVLTTTEDDVDLTRLINAHRGSNGHSSYGMASYEDDSVLHSAFIGSAGKQIQIGGKQSDDLNVFNVIDSPSPQKIEKASFEKVKLGSDVKKLPEAKPVTSPDQDRRGTVNNKRTMAFAGEKMIRPELSGKKTMEISSRPAAN